jgi:hypothetical protein
MTDLDLIYSIRKQIGPGPTLQRFCQALARHPNRREPDLSSGIRGIHVRSNGWEQFVSFAQRRTPPQFVEEVQQEGDVNIPVLSLCPQLREYCKALAVR